MYQFSYAEVAQDIEVDARERERQALDHSIEQLKKADAEGPRSRAAIEAIYTTRSLWALVIEDLASADNGLPEALRACAARPGRCHQDALQRPCVMADVKNRVEKRSALQGPVPGPPLGPLRCHCSGPAIGGAALGATAARQTGTD